MLESGCPVDVPSRSNFMRGSGVARQKSWMTSADMLGRVLVLVPVPVLVPVQVLAVVLVLVLVPVND
jgi:hypothetical protein